MNYYSLLIFFGICVTLIPNLGLPGSWKISMLSVLGVAIAALAYFAQRALGEDDDVASVLPEPEDVVQHEVHPTHTDDTRRPTHRHIA